MKDLERTIRIMEENAKKMEETQQHKIKEMKKEAEKKTNQNK